MHKIRGWQRQRGKMTESPHFYLPVRKWIQLKKSLKKTNIIMLVQFLILFNTNISLLTLKIRSQRESFIKLFLKQNERRLKTAFLCLQHSFLSLFTYFNCAKVDWLSGHGSRGRHGKQQSHRAIQRQRDYYLFRCRLLANNTQVSSCTSQKQATKNITTRCRYAA